MVTGAVVAVLGLGLFLAGASTLWSNDKGYIKSDDHRFSADSSALVIDNGDVELDVAGVRLDGDDLGKLRLDVESASSAPVFVGVARTDDVARYLRGVDHTAVTDVDYEPFEVSYAPLPGDRRVAPPASKSFWQAAATGTGAQKLTWDVDDRDGDWSVVVMNADGSRNVAVDVEADVKLSWLDTVAYSFLGSGVLLYIGATALIILGFRGRRTRTTPTAPAAPAAA